MYPFPVWSTAAQAFLNDPARASCSVTTATRKSRRFSHSLICSRLKEAEPGTSYTYENDSTMMALKSLMCQQFGRKDGMNEAELTCEDIKQKIPAMTGQLVDVIYRTGCNATHVSHRKHVPGNEKSQSPARATAVRLEQFVTLGARRICDHAVTIGDLVSIRGSKCCRPTVLTSRACIHSSPHCQE